MSIEQMLDQLADIQAQLDVLRLDKEAAISAAIPPEVLAEMDAIEHEFGQKAAAAQANADELAAAIRVAVLAHGATVKGARLQAVYSGGRITWDAKALDGYAVGHPEVLGFRKEGEPSVAIRAARNK